MARGHASSSRGEWLLPQTGCPSVPRLTHTRPHADWDRALTPVNLTCTSLGLGGKLGPQRKPAQMWGEHAHATHTAGPARSRIFFLINIERNNVEREGIVSRPAVRAKLESGNHVALVLEDPHPSPGAQLREEEMTLFLFTDNMTAFRVSPKE